MALSYSFHEKFNLVVMTGSGQLTARDFKDYITEYLCKDPRIKPGFIELGDMRAVEKNEITLPDMLEIVRLDETSGRPQPTKLAFVVNSDAEYGAVRQYASHVRAELKAVDVFRSMDEAKKWLGIEGIKLV
ncbi:hypothetical protein KKC97_03945 [bacterium]|nr:hypothetical protein [bacterium]MBU1636797.1 hypothetical protein [bacterium]